MAVKASSTPPAAPKAGLDRTDLAILEILRSEGRITFKDLAERISLSPRPCLERVRRLERSGVIKGYGAFIDRKRIAAQLTVHAQVALSNQSSRAAQKAFEDQMRHCAEVLECFLVSGQFDYFLRLNCRDLDHYRELTDAWLANPGFSIDRMVGHPELSALKTLPG